MTKMNTVYSLQVYYDTLAKTEKTTKPLQEIVTALQNTQI